MFRRKAKTMKTIRLPDNIGQVTVKPSTGVNTLYWWTKGNDEHESWVKADLYDTNGQLFASGLLGDTIDEIIQYIDYQYNIK